MGDTTTNAGGWESWFQNVAGSVINKAADAQYSQDYELQRLRLQALGETGFYTEGQTGTVRTAKVAGISPTTLLLIGGAVVLFMFMKD